MKPGRFELIQPETIEDAVSFKAAYDGEASVLAGGQSLVPMLNFRIDMEQICKTNVHSKLPELIEWHHFNKLT